MKTHTVSARTWRPQTFEEVIGQPHVTQTLQNAIRRDRIAQAYLFSGIRGVGKTTLARVFAKALNCTDRTFLPIPPCNQCDACMEITQGRAVDVLEIDGASNTGVDDVRELRERVKYLPMRGRYKIYIIDEVHMLSNAAFNALLKTLEEPPPHLVFILATTDPHRIPETVLSRCQHFTLRRLSRQEITAQLSQVAGQIGVSFTGEGLGLIARAAEGSMRDALTLLDQAILYGQGGDDALEGSDITEEALFALLGRVSSAQFPRLARAIYNKEVIDVLSLAKEMAEKGYDLRRFLSDWMEYLRHLIVARQVPGAEAWIDLPPEEIEEIRSLSALFSDEALQCLFTLFSKLQGEMRHLPEPHLLFEVALMKALLLSDLQPIERIIERLEALGVPHAAPAEKVSLPQTPPKAETVRRNDRPSAPISPIPPISPSPSPRPPPSPPRKIGLAPSHESWSAFVAHVKMKRPSIASYLETGTLVSTDLRSLTLMFSENTAFVMSLLQDGENKRWMDEALASHFQESVRLSLVAAPNAPVREASAHPFVQEVLSVFGGTVMEVPREKI